MARVGREVCEGKEGGLRSGFCGVRGGVWGVRVVEKAACENVTVEGERRTEANERGRRKGKIAEKNRRHEKQSRRRNNSKRVEPKIEKKQRKKHKKTNGEEG